MNPTTVRDDIDARLDRLIGDAPPSSTAETEFWGRQFDLGLAWVHHPVGEGGLGLDAAWQLHIDDRVRAAGGSLENRKRNVIGVGMAGGTIVTHGTADQRARHLRPIFTCEEIWCQLFSEPGAGSDLASLATSAVLEGDTWVVNGQKVWTTLGHVARWGLLVTRTDPSVPKHAGLTYFICDMQAPGVDVRPLFQMTGEAEFNEVYLTDVHLADDTRLGDVGQGWAVSMTTLGNERVAIGGAVPERGEGLIADALEAWGTHGGSPALCDELVHLWIEAESLRLTSARAAAGRRGGTPGPEGSTVKLHWAELNKDLTTFTMQLMGAEGMLYPDGYQFERPDVTSGAGATPQTAFLRARANSIEGGTSEIMKTIVGERVLGLPREPRADRNLPWNEVAR